MKIVVTGGTGFIGRALVELAVGLDHDVTVLTRGTNPTEESARLHFRTWDPKHAGSWTRELEGADAVFHLAGEPAVGKRLNDTLREEIRQSRLGSTATLVNAFETLTKPPGVFICSSGVGYYGARDPGEELDEESSAGDDFLARLCVDWEKAAARAETCGIRTVSARTGIVFGPDGGALEAMARPFKFFVGGPLGSGKQVVSWIHLNDMARALLFCAVNERLRGPVNLTAPEPVDNKTLSRILGEVLHRPSALPAPAFALRALLGDGADPILTGQRALPKKLLDAGFEFHFVDAKAAVQDALVD